MSNYVKAKMAFYHDQVGTRAHNEVFEVKNSETLSTLEQAGYVEKVDSQEMQEQQKLQEEVGKAQALANEAVSMTHHVQNQEANQHHQTVAQTREQVRQNSNLQQANQESQAQMQQNQNAAASRANAKKANEK